MRSSPNVFSKALSLVTAALCCILWLGMSALAAELPVEVSAQLTESTVAVTGTVQDDAVTRIGVLILNTDADLDNPDPADIVYVNEYDLSTEKNFSLEAKLPEADLHQYVLRIGGDNGLMYQKLLDGSEIPELPDASSSESSSEDASSDSSSTESGTEGTTSSSGSEGTPSDMESSGTNSRPASSDPAASDGGDDIQTGGRSRLILWSSACVLALLALGAVIILKKEGKRYE